MTVRVRMRCLAGALVLGAFVLPGPAAAAEVCPGTDAPTVAHAAPDTRLDSQFTRYGNSGDGWTGGDSTYSARLPDGRELWMFSDTFLGPISPPTRPATAALVNNSFVVQRGARMRTILGGTAAEPKALVAPAEPDHWYWLGAGTVHGSTLEVPIHEWQRTGPGIWDFAWVRNVLARFSTRRLDAPATITPLPSAANIEWTSWVERGRGTTYVYGVEDLGAHKYMHIARTQGSLTGTWEYYAGGGSWSSRESDSVRVLDGVSNEYSVHRLRKGLYMLTTMDTSTAFSAEMVAYFACSPTGPFVARTTLYTTPETGSFGSYADPDIYTYNAHAHPELSNRGHVVVSYNVNSFDGTIGGDHYQHVSIYRPRFVDVRLSR